MNHVHVGWLNQSYNSADWLKRFGAGRYRDEAWNAGLQAKLKTDMALCGYNHFGVHNDSAAVNGLGFATIPKIEFVKIAHSFVATEQSFPDVFDAAFERHCDLLAKQEAAPRKNDPWVLGYAFTDCPILTEEEAAVRPTTAYGSTRDGTPTWPRVLRNLPASAPGKRVWWELMRERYGNRLNDFQDAYGTGFHTWEELLAAEQWRPLTDLSNAREMADNRAFLERIVTRYYEVATAAVRRHDPHHLIFGDKLNANTNGGDAVVAITARHTDLVFYQMYDRWNGQRALLDRWSALAKKPFFNGDGTFSTTTDMMPSPHGPHAADQAERGEFAAEFGRNAFARPDFVGWSVCGWVDTWRIMPGKQHKQHSGFFDPQGNVHEPYLKRLQEIGRDLYRYAGAEK
jgi:hypothetical protein